MGKISFNLGSNNELKNSNLKFDCFITSPPYNLKSGTSGNITVHYSKYDDNMNNDEYSKNQIELLNLAFDSLNDDGHFFYNHKPRWEKGEHIHPLSWIMKSKFDLFQEIVWITNRKVDQSGYKFTPATERIYWLKKNKSNICKLQKSYITSDVWALGRSEAHNKHPAPFPLTLPLRILWSLYGEDKNKLICDPYLGSGTVGIACKILGHNFEGYDIDEDYIKSSEKRLVNYENELGVWEQEQQNYIVKKPSKGK